MKNARPASRPRVPSMASVACAGVLGLASWLGSSVTDAQAATDRGAEPTTMLAREDAPMAVHSATPTAPAAPALWGRYQHAGGAGAQENIRAAIERATADMAPGIRGIARNRLLESLKPFPSLRLERHDDVISIQKAGEPKIETSLGGAVQWTNSGGDEFTVRVRAKNQSLVETLKNQNTFTQVVYAPRGEELRVTTIIQDNRLPGKIQYTLVYAHE